MRNEWPILSRSTVLRDLLSYPQDDLVILTADRRTVASKAAIVPALSVCTVKALQHGVCLGVSGGDVRKLKVTRNTKQHHHV